MILKLICQSCDAFVCLPGSGVMFAAEVMDHLIPLSAKSISPYKLEIPHVHLGSDI
jgi:hypothetical protein